MTQQQLTLNLSLQDGFRFESFYITRENAELVQVLENLAKGKPMDNLLQCFIWGQAQSGKSHLLQACCYRASQCGLRVAYVPLKLLLPHGTRMIAGLDNANVIAIDDIDVLVSNPDLTEAQQKEWEAFFFHFINNAREKQQKLLFTAERNPRNLSFLLADLSSRLIWGASYALTPLSDQDMFLALQLRARQRGFELQDRVIDYLYKRYPRNLSRLVGLLERLDKESLRQGKKITIPFVKSLDNAD